MEETFLKNQNALVKPVDFQVDSSACLRCGACVRDCAFKVLSLGKAGMPEIGNPKRCMRCQHCIAVCPVGAITFDGVRSSDVETVKNLNLPNADQVANWIKSRRSIRKFADEDVDPETLEKAAGIRRTTPFYAILFGKSAVKYTRCVERSAYANIVYKNSKSND